MVESRQQYLEIGPERAFGPEFVREFQQSHQIAVDGEQDVDYDSFDAMLASLRFRNAEPMVTRSPSTGTTASTS